jgi:hypothetical protein
MMKNPVGSESATSKKAEWPSLYDSASGTGPASEVFSILDALDAPAKRSGVAKWMLFLLVIALLGAALLVYSANKAGVSFARQLELTTFTQLFGNKSEEELPDESRVAGTLSSMDIATPSTTTKTDTPQPAQTSVVFSSPSTPSDGEQQGATAMEASVVRPVVDIAGTLAAVSEPAISPSVKHAIHESQKRTTPATSKPVRQKSTSKDRTSAKPSRTPKSHVHGTRNDRDVDLIAALLSHVSVAGSDRRELSSVSARKTNSLSGERLSGPLSKKGSTPDSSRDVVLQSAVDTTDTLVKRCQALGFFEGQLCRLRICSGHWGKDAACPVNSLDRSDS